MRIGITGIKLVAILLILTNFNCYSQGGGIGGGNGSGGGNTEDGFDEFYYDALKLNLIPPSPSVSGMQGFFEVPVSYNSGRYNISIPIWTLSSDIANIDISIEYATNGVKVEEVAGVLGMGWNLNAGGTISRVIRGRPDEDYHRGAWKFLNDNDFLSFYSNPQDFFNKVENYQLYNFTPKGLASWLYYMFELNIAGEGQGASHSYLPLFDFELDLFSYSFNGYSGKFFVAPNQKVVHLDDNGLDFECIVKTYSNAKTEIIGFRAFDGNGRIYEFGGNYISGGNTKVVEEVEIASYSRHSSPQESAKYNTAWHLTSIKRHGFPDAINFSYSAVFENTERVSTSKLMSDLGGTVEEGRINSSITVSKYRTFKIKTIQHKDMQIGFDYTNGRDDMITENGKKCGVKLNSISIFKTGTGRFKIKEYIFNSSYYMSDLEEAFGSNEAYLLKRLFLNSIEIKEGNYNQGEQSLFYKFYYNNPNKMPKQNSVAQDLWGYYNGQICKCITCVFGNKTLIPKVNINSLELTPDGANRNINTHFISFGTLKTMQYPTGGTVHLSYEPNDYYDESQNKNVLAGGLRISKIDYKDVNNELEKRLIFEYTKQISNSLKVSSGCIPVEAIPIFYRKQMYKLQGGTACVFSTGYNISEQPVNEMFSYRGNSLTYTEVSKKEVSIYDNSKIIGQEVFKYFDPEYHNSYLNLNNFRVFENVDGAIINNCLKYSSSIPGDIINYFIHPNIEINSLAGTLKEHLVYESLNSNSMRVIKKSEYEYEWENISENLYLPYIRPSLNFFQYDVCFHSPEAGLFGCGSKVMGNIIYGALDINNRARIKREKTTDFYYQENGSSSNLISITDYYYGADNPLKPEKVYSTVVGSDIENVMYQKYMPKTDLSHIPEELWVYPEIITRKRVGTKKSNTYHLENGLIIEYNNSYQPISVKRELPKDFQSMAFDPVYNNVFQSIPYMSFEYDSTSKKLIMETRDFTSNNKLHTSYIWGYNNNYPIAKIENMNIHNIPSSLFLEIRKLQNFSFLNSGQINSVKNINNTINSLLPEDAFITTFTFAPYVGMTSTADTRTEIMFYEYDGLQRLTKVMDKNKKILQTHDYNYALNIYQQEEESEPNEITPDPSFTIIDMTVKFLDILPNAQNYYVQLLSECNHDYSVVKTIGFQSQNEGKATFNVSDFIDMPPSELGWFEVRVYTIEQNNIYYFDIESPKNKGIYVNISQLVTNKITVEVKTSSNHGL